MKINTEELKQAYINGKEVNEICTIFAISSASFYYHKKAELKKGINWDILRLANNRENIEEKEAIFLDTLIRSFDKFIQESKELSPETLDKLHKYATTYWKLKAPKDIDTQSLTIQAVKNTIKAIADIALESKDKAVVDFLAKNSEKIINSLLKKK